MYFKSLDSLTKIKFHPPYLLLISLAKFQPLNKLKTYFTLVTKIKLNLMQNLIKT